MMKAILLFAMMSTVMGLRRAPPMPQQVHINPLGMLIESIERKDLNQACTFANIC